MKYILRKKREWNLRKIAREKKVKAYLKMCMIRKVNMTDSSLIVAAAEIFFYMFPKDAY